jgi:hypothetical protein
LLTTVDPQQFDGWFVEPAGGCFEWFGSRIKPKGSIVEPTVNALRKPNGALGFFFFFFFFIFMNYLALNYMAF